MSKMLIIFLPRIYDVEVSFDINKKYLPPLSLNFKVRCLVGLDCEVGLVYKIPVEEINVIDQQDSMSLW